MGVGPIPRSKIIDYAKSELGLSGEDERERFYSLIRQVDDAYVGMSNSTSKKPERDKGYQVPISDGTGVKNLLQGIVQRKKLIEKAQQSRVKTKS